MEKGWGGGVNIEKSQKGNYLEGRETEPPKMLGENAASDYRFQLSPKLSILLWRNADLTADRNAKQD